MSINLNRIVNNLIVPNLLTRSLLITHIYVLIEGVRKIAPRKIAHRSESGFGLGLALELGLGGNFPRRQFS